MLKGLSVARVSAYSREQDTDSIDCIARYIWNLALGAALWPAVHTLEILVRNALFMTGEEQSKGRPVSGGRVGCWLDAGFLEKREHQEVEEAISRLGPGRETPGHLVQELSFGFWLRLCNRPYEHGRRPGIPLWPAAAKRFYRCPRENRHRAGIRNGVERGVDLRNRIAHHHAIWDRRPDKRFLEVVEVIDWISPPLAHCVKETSTLVSLYTAGHEPFRDFAGSLVSGFS